LLRFFAGAAAAFLLLTSVFLIWQLRAEQGPGLPAAPAAGTYQASMLAQSPLRAPEASPQDREKRRFSRFDKNKDGKVQADEYLAARHRNFDKLDIDHNGALAFQEYAVKGIEKFDSAGGKKGWLTPAEFVATAPPAPKHKTCSCNAAPQVADNNDD